MLPFASAHRPRVLAACVLLSAASALAQQPKKDPPPPSGEQRAKEAFKAGKLDEAIKLLQEAAKADPSLSPPKVIASRWCVEAGQGQQARLLIERAAIEDPGHPDVFLTNASFALAEMRVTDTILSCNAALAAAENPRWDAEARKRYQREARLGLADAFAVRGDFASVKTQLLALLERDANNALLRQRLAQANFLLNKPEDAFADLQTAHKADPTLDPPELSMAKMWTTKRDFPKAEEWYGKAVAAHPNSARVQRDIAGYMLDRGRLDTARAHLAAAQKIEPNAKETKAMAGLIARYARDYKAATATFEELVKDYPSFGFAVVNLALVLAEDGDADARRRAIELADGYVRQNPRAVEGRAILAYCLLKAGRTADAERVARSVEGLGAASPDAAYFIAKVLAERQATDEAHRIVKSACESKDGFVYRKEAEALLAELDKKVTPPKK
jgi:tetratricopeptide (TPR) repeat protein